MKRDAHLAPVSGGDGYLAISRQPLTTLVFLLPLIVAFEACLALVLRSGDGLTTNTVEAHRQLLAFFSRFGIAPGGGLYLGGIVIVVVLFVWHLLRRDRWRVSWPLLMGMGAESLLLAVPLLLLGSLISGGMATVPPAGFSSLDLMSQMAISVGAGLYEELAFRMILIAALHTLLVDIGGLPDRLGTTIAIIVSAIAFTTYHDLHGPDGVLSYARVVFLLAAGGYFGAIYAVRGFGIVVGVHAAYDILTVLLSHFAAAAATG